LALVGSDTKQDAALTASEDVGVVAQSGKIGRQCRHRSTFAAPSANDSLEFLNGLTRLALATSQLFKQRALRSEEALAHRGDHQHPPR
jgi:hypothetical protein